MIILINNFGLNKKNINGNEYGPQGFNLLSSSSTLILIEIVDGWI